MREPEDVAVSHEAITASSVLSRGPCWLYGAVATDDNGGGLRIREGTDVNARPVVLLQTIGGLYETVTFLPVKPLYLQRGLFAEVTSAMILATIIWVPEPLAGGIPNPPEA